MQVLVPKYTGLEMMKETRLHSGYLDYCERASVKDILIWGEAVLEGASIPDPATEAEYLLSSIMGCSRPRLRLMNREVVSKEVLRLIADAFKRRIKREPVQHIIGREEFMGLSFRVTHNTFIPRPETELLVEEAVREIGNGCVTVFDIGTGSGCIAIAIAAFCPNAHCYAVDISSKALAIARENAEYHNLTGRTEFFKGDMFEPFVRVEDRDKADIIISNPPYLSAGDMESVQPEVKFFEPYEALYGGSDGLAFYHRIIGQAPFFLKEGGRMILETGHSQCLRVMKLFEAGNFHWDISNAIDYSGIYRLVNAKIV